MQPLEAKSVNKVNAGIFKKGWDDPKTDVYPPQEQFELYANGPKPKVDQPATANIGPAVLKGVTQIDSVPDAQNQQPSIK